MSYILDALKKSDQERKRGDVPNLQTVHIPVTTEQHTPWMLYGFISFLLVLLAFVIGMMISEKGVATDSEAVQLEDIVEPEIVVVYEAEASAELPVVEKEVYTEPVIKQQPAVQPVTKILDNDPKKELSSKKQVEPVILDSETLESDINEIPYLHELPEYQQSSIPEMNFAGHVYSSRSSSRSVIINGSEMSEGDTIVQGLDVVQITPSGVIFKLHNEQFRMDILQDWSFE